MSRRIYRKVLGIALIALAVGSVLVASNLLVRFGSDRKTVSDYESTCRWVRAERDRMATNAAGGVTDHDNLHGVRDL